MASPHRRPGVADRDDHGEILVPAGQQRGPLGEQQCLQRRCPHVLRSVLEPAAGLAAPVAGPERGVAWRPLLYRGSVRGRVLVVRAYGRVRGSVRPRSSWRTWVVPRRRSASPRTGTTGPSCAPGAEPDTRPSTSSPASDQPRRRRHRKWHRTIFPGPRLLGLFWAGQGSELVLLRMAGARVAWPRAAAAARAPQVSHRAGAPRRSSWVPASGASSAPSAEAAP